MAVTFSVTNAPERVVAQLQARAERHQRSFEGEVLAIIEAAIASDDEAAPSKVLFEVRRLGLTTASDSVSIVRADRERNGP
ncbi:MAG: Arc family DNA-binding protein [Gemmatimonadaceae bacterium]|nr:Arc family DNA-binding protein [Acetobacteraceae bacterium]